MICVYTGVYLADISSPGLGAADILKAVMEVFPLDQYVEQPVSVESMQGRELFSMWTEIPVGLHVAGNAEEEW